MAARTGFDLADTAKDLQELHRACGGKLLDLTQCERLRTLRKGISDRADLVDRRYWATDPDLLDSVKNADRYFHYTIASVCTGIRRTPEGFDNPLAHELRLLAREDRYSVADVGAVLLEAAEVFDTEARPHAPGSHTDDGRNRVPTDATGRKLYVLLWAILFRPEREWFDTSKPRSVEAFGCYAEFDRYKAYGGPGLPHSKKAGLAWPVRLGDGPLDHRNRIWNEAAGEVWRLCWGDVDRDEGRRVLGRLAGSFGAAPQEEPSGTPPIPLSAHAHARLRVGEVRGEEASGDSMADLQAHTSRLVAENPWIREPLRAAAAWALEKYSKNEELKRGNRQRVFELCRALLTSGRIRDPNLSHTPSEWLEQVIWWPMPASVADFLGARSGFYSFTQDEEQRIAPELLAALNAGEAWDRLSKAEKMAESERFLASPEAEAMRRVWWQVFIAKPEDWVEPSFLLSLDPDSQGTMPERERVAIWLVALGGLFDSRASYPIVPRPTGSEHEVFLGNDCWDGRCIRIDPTKKSPSGLWYEGATPFRMSELVMFLEKWVREGAVPEGWGRLESEAGSNELRLEGEMRGAVVDPAPRSEADPLIVTAVYLNSELSLKPDRLDKGAKSGRWNKYKIGSENAYHLNELIPKWIDADDRVALVELRDRLKPTQAD
jgi:hypothetical protein